MLVIMYENDEWLSPLTEALDRHGLNYKTCFIHSAALSFKDLIPSSLTKDEKVIKIGDENESLVFVSRCSASAFLRNHIASYQHFRLLLNYLQENSFKVVNGIQGMEMEVSKSLQYMRMKRFGIAVPEYRIIIGSQRDDFLEAAQELGFPLIIKPNCGGKGFGVSLFKNEQELLGWLKGSLDEYVKKDSIVDGIIIMQRYIQSPLPRITRVEILNGQLLYAMHVSTQSGFELCPADACATPLSNGVLQQRFTVRNDLTIDHELIQKYKRLMGGYQIDVAGFEFIEDQNGHCFTYDINVSTNYSTKIQNELGKNCYDDLVNYFASLLNK